MIQLSWEELVKTSSSFEFQGKQYYITWSNMFQTHRLHNQTDSKFECSGDRIDIEKYLLGLEKDGNNNSLLPFKSE
jgi:hypothetical protein